MVSHPDESGRLIQAALGRSGRIVERPLAASREDTAMPMIDVHAAAGYVSRPGTSSRKTSPAL